MQLLSTKTYITSTMFCFFITQSTTTHTMHIAPMDKKAVLGTLAVITAGTCGYGLYKVGHAFNKRMTAIENWQKRSEQTAAAMTQNMQQRDKQLSEQWNERIKKFDQYDAKNLNVDVQFLDIGSQLKNLVELIGIESDRGQRLAEELRKSMMTQAVQGTRLKALEIQTAKPNEAITSSQAKSIIAGLQSLTLIDEKLQKGAEDSGDRIGNLETHVADLNESMKLLDAFVHALPAQGRLSLQGSRSGKREKIQSKRPPSRDNFGEDLAEQDEQMEILSVTSESSLTSMSSAPSEDPLEVSLKELAAGIDDETLDEFLNT
jgi:hypothetical protein